MISLLIVSSALCLPAYASADAGSAISNQSTGEDSTFVLANSDVQISDDDYISESAYSSEIESSNFNPEITESTQSVLNAETKTVGDPMVYLTQKWLNQEYRNVSGFGSVPENGKTGWDTVYGLLRALQHELGITSLADSFGPTTSNLYAKNPLSRQDGVINRQFAILQGALWCKGYAPGYHLRENADGTVSFDEVFNADVERAVIALKTDAGFTNPNGTVTLNVMKALMSMDSFKLLSSYGGDAKIRSMQQKLNRKYEAYTGLNPCDGVYGRNTNKALIYALQAEEGLPTSVANGNFGNTTKLCCPNIPYAKNSSAARRYPGTASGSYYTSTQISAMTEFLQFALYVNGFGDGVTDGVFDSGTQQAVRNFQKKYAISQTGIADKGTWLSLFVSCGDTARSAKAADCATILTAAKAKSLYDNGYRYIGRYLTGTYNGGISKAITREEANLIFNAGLNFFPIYQTSARSAAYFTEEQGVKDAEAAIEASLKLGIPKDTIIYFAVDFDAMDYQITSNILPYFKKVSQVMKNSIYQTGIYGTRNACIRAAEAGYTVSSFVGDMSTGFSGNLGYSMPDNWAFDQFYTTSIGSGAGFLEIDKDGFSGRDHGVSKLELAQTPTLDEVVVGSGGSDVVNGPTVNILGHDVPLFSLDIGLDAKIAQLETHYNQVDNTLQVLMGVNVYGEASETMGSTEKEGKYKQAYGEVRSLVSALGKNDREFARRFRDYKGSLYQKGTKVGFDMNTYFAGYMTIKCDTGKVIEGGLGIMGSVKHSISYPIVPTVFAKFAIEGSLQSGFQLKYESDKIVPQGTVEFGVKPSFSVGVDVLVANAYAGIAGEMACAVKLPSSSLQDALEITLSASVFFEYSALVWGNNYEWEFAQTKLFPTTNTAQTLSVARDDLKFIEPINKTTAKYAANTRDAFAENMQVYCQPQIISLGNGKMLMAYIDDAPDRTAENRTILMYSIFDGTSWSTPQAVLDDGTGDFQPVIAPDGNGGAHIVWQNAKKAFDSNVTLEEMSSGTELHYTHWNGTTFNNTVAVTNNNDYEMGCKVTSTGQNLSVVWQQNSENDPFAVNGTNTIYRKQFLNGVWQNTQTVASELQIINSLETAYVQNNNVIAYTAKTTSDSSTIKDLEVFYFDGSSTTRLTNDDAADYSVSFLGDELYWISGDSVVSVTNGNLETKTLVLSELANNVSKMKAVENTNGQKAIVWTQEDDANVKFYGSYYNTNTNKFGLSEPLSNGYGVIRGWDACVLPDGQIELAFGAADKLTEPVNGRPYGQIDLIQKSANKVCDISVNPLSLYDGEVAPNKEITLLADIHNSGSKAVSQFDVNIIDASNNVVQTASIDKKLAVGESAALEIPFTLPSSISKSDYTVEILPHGENDIAQSDNKTTFTIGYSDLAIKNVQEIRTANGRQLKVTVVNQGFEKINTASLKILDEGINGPVLSNQTILPLTPGAEAELTFNIEEATLDSDVSPAPSRFYLLVETSEEESDYGNNSQEAFVYPDYAVNLAASTGGTVQGLGKYAYASSATVYATPNAGYLFAGWYENGKLLDSLSEEYTFTVKSNRSLEARFIPNNLSIIDVELFGTLQAGNSITFTSTAIGGGQPYQWEFYIYKGEEICYTVDNASVNFFEWIPSQSGNYKIVANVTDATGFKVSYTKSFSIA